ncbi:MAG: InlB B-repeat-containing protein [Clostridia bacterium]|nr:InlB B-repeat-containing protein [Clostridia bacterium]
MGKFFKSLFSLILVAGLIGGGYYLVDKNTDIFDRLFSRQYEITFIVEGESKVQKVVYGTIPEYDGTPEKEPTETIEYVFDGWEPELVEVKGPATYTAKFREQTRKYTVNIVSNYAGGGDYVGAGKIYEYETNGSVTVTPKYGYNFLGWFESETSDTVVEASTTIDLGTITHDVNVYPRFETTKHNVSYVDSSGATNPNKTIIDATDGVYELAPLSKNGYVFKGWLLNNNPLAKITEIDCTQDNALMYLNPITLYSSWELITYNIAYNLKGGSVASPNPTTYTVEDLLDDNTITLNNPTKTDCTFLGWIGTGLNGTTLTVVLRNGDYGDRAYTALYDDERAISFVVDGMSLSDDVMITNVGVACAAPVINSANYGMGGYNINGWYTDAGCTSPYTFTVGPADNLTLYGRWEYFIGEGFYPYKTTFDNFVATYNGSPLRIYSYEELVAWVEYVEFNYITTNYTIKIEYTIPGGSSKQGEVEKAVADSYYALNGTYSLSGSTFYLSSASKATEAKNHVAVPVGDSYPQQVYVLKYDEATTRPADFDEFHIGNVSHTLNVDTSNQLVYALERGLRPICKAGSMAETVYNEAKEILAEICDDSMSDINKLRAIYEWLIENVTYDYEAANNSAYNSTWYLYDSWFAEGAIIHKKAVCDGFAKALLILAQIENIPTIRVSGDGHAWNKVYLDGKWYGVDATHGNLKINVGLDEVETTQYAQFMFTDEFKTSKGYTATNHTVFVANTAYNYYQTQGYTYGLDDFDLVIDSEAELTRLVGYAKNHRGTKRSQYYTIDFVFAGAILEENYSTYINHACSANSVSVYVPITSLGVNSSGLRIYGLMIQYSALD